MYKESITSRNESFKGSSVRKGQTSQPTLKTKSIVQESGNAPDIETLGSKPVGGAFNIFDNRFYVN